MLKKLSLNDPSAQHKENSLKIVKAIRKIKKSFQWDIYKDFYNFGEPSTEHQGTLIWHGFKINFMAHDQLTELLNHKISMKIRSRFLDSDAYL